MRKARAFKIQQTHTGIDADAIIRAGIGLNEGQERARMQQSGRKLGQIGSNTCSRRYVEYTGSLIER